MRWRAAACLRALCLLLHLRAAGCFSGDSDHFLAIHQRKSGKPVFIYHHVESVEKSLDTDSYKDSKQNFHSSSHTKISKLHPAIIVKSAFPRSVYDPSLNLLAMTGQDLEVENLPIPTTNVIIVTLQMDVNKLNMTLLRIFRQGVAAALGLLPQQVHINRLIGKKNCVELFVSPLNRKPGISEALPSEEVLRSLNINILHQSLSQFGITEVSPEDCHVEDDATFEENESQNYQPLSVTENEISDSICSNTTSRHVSQINWISQ